MISKKIGFFFSVFILLGVCAQAQENVKVACIGNSVTYGSGLANPETDSYPAQLQNMLGNGYSVGNFGHSGATLLKKGHNPYFKTAEFAEALNFDADIAIIHLGLNDTDPRNWPNYKREFNGDYSWLIDTLKSANPKMKVYICKMTPIFSGHSRFLSGTFDWFWAIQNNIPRIAQANNVNFIDLWEPFHARPDLFPDNLHPNEEGAEILAKTIYQTITGNFGGLHLPELFGDNMVLQRNKPIPVWGTANAGDRILVKLGHKTLSTIAEKNGKWQVNFAPMEAGGPYCLEIKSKEETIDYENILLGDVWLCSGQSNMYFLLRNAKNGQKAIEDAGNHPNIRLFKFEPLAETNNTAWDSTTLSKVNQLEYFSGNWRNNTSKSAEDFSAIAYFFGREIQERENVPIGLIEMAVGGSTQISWIDRLTLERDPLLVNTLHNWRKSDFIQDWCRGRVDKNLSGTDFKGQRHPYEPAYNFEAGISKLVKFPIKGAIWYQGASDANNAELFAKEFPVMVSSWRKHWGYDFPFYYVQLSSISRPSWPYFREMQRKLVETIAYSGMVVSSDLGHPTNIHPQKKKKIGLRLANLALSDTYGHRNIAAYGPMPIKAVRKGHSIEISFQNAESLQISNGTELVGFELKTDKGAFLKPFAKIQNNKVVLKVPANLKVNMVVYAWKGYSNANLVNKAGLPASTFSLQIQ